MQAISFHLNGRAVVATDASPGTTLLDHIRGEGLTGAKEGCAEGECGACTVVMVGAHDVGSAYRAVNSCLMLLPMAAGHEIYTVEALAGEGNLCEAQAAMAAAGASQCGYCTPGFVMSLFAEQYRPDREGLCDPYQMGGNLCRCTGYRPIRDAALSLGPAPAGSLRERLTLPPPRLEAMEGPLFSRPTTLEDCVSILAADPAAKVIAGGTDLGVEANLKGKRWNHLVSLEAIPELQAWEETAERVLIGAALPLTDVLRRWNYAPLKECLVPFASPTIRNRATLGGNLGNASPIGDSAPLLMALDASVRIVGPEGRRAVPLAAFFTGYRQTTLQLGEFIAAVEVPKPWPDVVRFFKVSKRRMDDISTVAAGFAVSLDGDGRVSLARLAFGGVADRTVRAPEAEEVLVGQPWTQASIARAQAALAQTLKPMTDHRGSAAYRLAVAQSLLEKFWYESTGVRGA